MAFRGSVSFAGHIPLESSLRMHHAKQVLWQGNRGILKGFPDCRLFSYHGNKTLVQLKTRKNRSLTSGIICQDQLRGTSILAKSTNFTQSHSHDITILLLSEDVRDWHIASILVSDHDSI